MPTVVFLLIAPDAVPAAIVAAVIITKTLDTLCFILDCEVQDILLHDKEVDTTK